MSSFRSEQAIDGYDVTLSLKQAQCNQNYMFQQKSLWLQTQKADTKVAMICPEARPTPGAFLKSQLTPTTNNTGLPNSAVPRLQTMSQPRTSVTIYEDNHMMDLAWPSFLRQSYTAWVTLLHTIERDQRRRHQHCAQIENDPDAKLCDEEQEALRRTKRRLLEYDGVIVRLLEPGGLEVQCGTDDDVACRWKFARLGPLVPNSHLVQLAREYTVLRHDPAFSQYRRETVDIFRYLKSHLPTWQERMEAFETRVQELTDRIPPFQSKLLILQSAKEITLAKGYNRGFDVVTEWDDGRDYDMEIDDANREILDVWTDAFSNAYQRQIYDQIESHLYHTNPELREGIESVRADMSS